MRLFESVFCGKRILSNLLFNSCCTLRITDGKRALPICTLWSLSYLLLDFSASRGYACGSQQEFKLATELANQGCLLHAPIFQREQLSDQIYWKDFPPFRTEKWNSWWLPAQLDGFAVYRRPIGINDRFSSAQSLRLSCPFHRLLISPNSFSVYFWSPQKQFSTVLMTLEGIFSFFDKTLLWCALLFMMTNSLDRLAHLFNSSYGTSTINNFPVRKFRIRILCPIDKFSSWGILLNFGTFCVMSLCFNGAHSVFENHPKKYHLNLHAKNNSVFIANFSNTDLNFRAKKRYFFELFSHNVWCCYSALLHEFLHFCQVE